MSDNRAALLVKIVARPRCILTRASQFQCVHVSSGFNFLCNGIARVANSYEQCQKGESGHLFLGLASPNKRRRGLVVLSIVRCRHAKLVEAVNRIRRPRSERLFKVGRLAATTSVPPQALLSFISLVSAALFCCNAFSHIRFLKGTFVVELLH